MAAVLYCGNCGAANAPGTAFCGSCGAALARAAAAPAAAAPAARAQAPPAGAPVPAYAGGYAYPQYQQVPYRQAVAHKTQWWIWGVAGGGVLFAMIVLGILAVALAPPSNPNCTAPNCQKTKLAPPLGAPHRYTSKAVGYSVEYYDHPEYKGAVKLGTQDDKSIGWQIGSWPWVINGDKVSKQSARQVVESIQQQKFADAQYLYTLPGVTFGATGGYGNVYRVMLKNNGGQSVEARLVIAAAVKDDIAVELLMLGPYIKSTKDDGHPNPSNTPVSGIAGETIKFVYWPGDPEL